MSSEPLKPTSGNHQLDMENLRAMLGFVTTQRERAEMEGRMFELASKDDRKGGCAKWVARTLSVSLRPAEARNSLRQAGPAAEALWARVDGTERMLLESASGALSRARLRAVAENVALVEAVARELAEYDTWNLHSTKNGTFRKPTQRARGFGKRSTHEQRKRIKSRPSGSARDLWSAVRAALKRVVDAELAELADSHAREVLRGQMEAELSGAVDLLHTRVRTAKKHSQLDGVPSILNVDVERRKLRDACLVLSVDPPAPGKFIIHAVYAVAKRNYKRLVREYHPDHGGNVERYHAVVEAMQAIESNYQAADSKAPSSTNTESDGHGEQHDDHE